MANDSTFVFYESFLKTIQNVERFKGKEVAYDFFLAIAEYGCYGLIPDANNPAWLYGFEQIKTNLDYATSRYNKAVENGKKGGRTKKAIDIEEILWMSENNYTQQQIADELGVSLNTIKRRLRDYREGQNNNDVFEPNSSKAQKGPKELRRGQNLNVNVNVNKNDNIKSYINFEEKDTLMGQEHYDILGQEKDQKDTVVRAIEEKNLSLFSSPVSAELKKALENILAKPEEIIQKCIRLFSAQELSYEDIDWLIDNCEIDLQLKQNFVYLGEIRWRNKEKEIK